MNYPNLCKTFESSPDGARGSVKINNNINRSLTSVLSPFHQLFFVKVFIPSNHVNPVKYQIYKTNFKQEKDINDLCYK